MTLPGSGHVVGPVPQRGQVAGDRAHLGLLVQPVGVHHGHGRGEVPELPQLLGGEGGLGRAAAAQQGDPLDGGGGQDVEHVLGDVGGLELGGGAGQHPGDVQRDVADPDDHDVPGPRQRRLHPRAVGVGVPGVPGHQVGGGQAAGQVLALDAQPAGPGGAVGEDDGVGVRAQVGHRQVAADLHVADEPHARVVQGVPQRVGQRPHLQVVGGDAVPHQPERRGQPVQQVDHHRDVVLGRQRLGGVDARRTGTHDGHPQRSVHGRILRAGHRGHQPRAGFPAGQA